MLNKRVLISGASIAGPALAYLLARRGFQPTVVERAPALRQGGNGVDVREQAIEVAERMGIIGRIREAATDVRGMSFVNGSGRSVARIDMQAIQRKHGSGEAEIMRGDLARILYDVSKDDTEYVFDDSVQSLEQDAGGVNVSFERCKARRFDLVIGADGMHSAVRRIAFGSDGQFLKFLNHYFAFADADPAFGADRWMTLYNLPGRMAGVYRSGNHAGAKAYFIFHQPAQLTYDHRDVEHQKRLLGNAFSDVSAWHVPGLIAAAQADPAFYFDALSQVRMPSWSTGRVALIGDAAHCASPVSGGGAMLGLIGAYRLAGELAEAGGDYEVGFLRYEQAHRGLVERSQGNLFTAMVVPRTRKGVLARNAMARLPILGAMAGIERRLQPKNAPLPDYGFASSANLLGFAV